MSTKQRTSSFSWSRFFKFVAFWAVICIGISLALSLIFKEIAGAFKIVGDILSYVVALSASFSYVIYKRNIWYYIGWIVSLVLIVLYCFIGI